MSTLIIAIAGLLLAWSCVCALRHVVAVAGERRLHRPRSRASRWKSGGSGMPTGASLTAASHSSVRPGARATTAAPGFVRFGSKA